MSYYQQVSYTTTGTKASLNLDPSIVPFNAFIAATVTGTATYGLQYSLSPFGSVQDADAIWFDVTDIPAGTATSATSVFTAPIARVRAVIAAVSGTVTLQIRQGLSTN